MVIEYVRYNIAPEDALTFEAAYEQAAANLDAAPQCLSYELARGIEEPGHYILRIEWSSVTDHEQGFRSGPEFGAFFAAIRPYVGNIDEMQHYQQTTVVSSPRPGGMRTVGVVGAGRMGSTLAALLGGADEQVLLANTQGPASLEDLVASLGPAVRAAPIEDAVAAPVVFLAIPHGAVADVAARRADWHGQIVVDVTNYFSARDGQPGPTSPGGTSSQAVAGLLSGAHVVKAFNTIHWQTLRNDPDGRLPVPVAADDEDAFRTVSDLVDRMGHDPVPAGGLADTRNLEPGGPLFNRPMTRDEMEARLR